MSEKEFLREIDSMRKRGKKRNCVRKKGRESVRNE